MLLVIQCMQLVYTHAEGYVCELRLLLSQCSASLFCLYCVLNLGMFVRYSV